jgi:hypothetical protein
MLTIINGDLDKIKAEIKQVKQWKSEEIKELKKLIKSKQSAEKKAAKEENRKVNPYPRALDEKLDALEEQLALISSRLVPVQVEGITINFSIYQNAMKKLKGFEIDIKIENGQFELAYKKNKTRGAFYLFDVSPHYTGFHHVPIAEIKADA